MGGNQSVQSSAARNSNPQSSALTSNNTTQSGAYDLLGR